MSISLNKGGNLSLSQQAPGLTNILVGLGWDTRSSDEQGYDGSLDPLAHNFWANI